MSKTALLFAGQGAQAPGMGKDLADRFPTAKKIFDQANAVLGYNLSSICFAGPEEELTKTENAQPGIFLVSWVALELMRERLPTLTFEAAAGLSLGELSALVAVEAIHFEEGLKLVRLRGRFMAEACEQSDGGMAAIIGLEEDLIRQVCAQTGVEVANLNCPGQIVISGERSKLAAACDLAKQKGAKRALPLPVAGAYHSKLMESAQPKLRQAVSAVTFRTPAVPVISNVTARPYASATEIQERLVEQITSPVRWEESMNYLLEQGFTRFVELGPGTALTGFMKRIDKRVQVLNVSNVISLKTTVEALVARE